MYCSTIHYFQDLITCSFVFFFILFYSPCMSIRYITRTYYHLTIKKKGLSIILVILLNSLQKVYRYSTTTPINYNDKWLLYNILNRVSGFWKTFRNKCYPQGLCQFSIVIEIRTYWQDGANISIYPYLWLLHIHYHSLRD